MSMRARKKLTQEKHGWPDKISWRDKGEWVPSEDSAVFHRVTCGRCSMTAWPRQAWRKQ